ncbi:hypothetical protein TYRP_010422 [Tyrophagus putrescentiae]|nr:hypothetical protein TYRP_010422 [Tyrophagus putrescentiae]
MATNEVQGQSSPNRNGRQLGKSAPEVDCSPATRLKRRLKSLMDGSSADNDTDNDNDTTTIANICQHRDHDHLSQGGSKKGRTKKAEQVVVKKATANPANVASPSSSAQKSPPAAASVTDESKSPAKKCRRNLEEVYDEIGLMAGFITDDIKPKKCLPNSSNLERLFQKNDDQINQRRRQRRQSCPNKGTPKKKSNSSGKLLDSADLIGDDLDDLPSSFLEESLLLLSSSSSRRSLTSSSSESKLSRAKVSLVNRKRSQLDDYSRALPSADDSTVTPPLTPERPPPPSSTTSSFSSSCRSADSGQLRLSSLEGLLLPECNSISGGISSGNHRAGSPLSPYSYSLFSPLASSPLVGSRRGSSSGGSAQQISAQQRTRDGGGGRRHSHPILVIPRIRQETAVLLCLLHLFIILFFFITLFLLFTDHHFHHFSSATPTENAPSKWQQLLGDYSYSYQPN